MLGAFIVFGTVVAYFAIAIFLGIVVFDRLFPARNQDDVDFVICASMFWIFALPILGLVAFSLRVRKWTGG